MASSLVQYKQRAAAARLRYKSSSDEAEKKLTLGAAAALLGWAEKSKTIPLTWFGVPSKVVLAVGGYLIAFNSSGGVRRIANAASDAAVATYAYNAARTGGFIAGDDDDIVNVQGDEI